MPRFGRESGSFFGITHGGAINGPMDDPWLFVLQHLFATVAPDPEAFPRDEGIGFIFDTHELSEPAR
jgi:hypothetical protein